MHVSYHREHSIWEIRDDITFRRNIAWHNCHASPSNEMGGFVCYGLAYDVTFDHNVSIDNNGPGFFVYTGTEDPTAVMQEYGPMPSSTFWFRNNVAHGNVSEWPALYVGLTPSTTEFPGWSITIIAEGNDWSVPASQEFAVTSMGNDYTAAQVNAGAFGTGNMSVDPLLVSGLASPPDVHLQSVSPCIDQGMDWGQFYAGSAPDIGRYEYGAP